MGPAGAPQENVEALWQGLWPRSDSGVAPLRFRHAPLLAAAIWFAAGIVCARWWQPAGVLLIAAFALAMVAVVALRSSLRIAMVPIAAVWCVLGWWCAEVQPVRSSPVPQAQL